MKLSQNNPTHFNHKKFGNHGIEDLQLGRIQDNRYHKKRVLVLLGNALLDSDKNEYFQGKGKNEGEDKAKGTEHGSKVVVMVVEALSETAYYRHSRDPVRKAHCLHSNTDQHHHMHYQRNKLPEEQEELHGAHNRIEELVEQ